ncbi:FHA domain-containing protein [Pontibacillus yanchengensis]|uniref:FHA domain-containing protein n=2 Tax=Pontibacillus yanchengensis TaxID=462910 RepID=A0A6I5A2P7_9BACI|nr:FHA domain-containing protein [Pontibacillus yanchengensis]MYL52540.1 FHA domain-containing protein [Pontibacillus yanchengensis]
MYRKHAEIYSYESNMYIKDLGSRHGTWVNKHQLPCYEEKTLRGYN